jgi:hypothetical protein
MFIASVPVWAREGILIMSDQLAILLEKAN